MEIFKQTLTDRVVKDLKQRSVLGIVMYPIALTAVLFGDGYFFRHPSFAFQFLVLIAGICILRLVHHRINPLLPRQYAGISLWVTMGEILFTALIWGIGFALFMSHSEESSTHLLMVICTIGLCSGGATAYIPYLWLALGFNLMILGPGLIYFSVLAFNLPLLILFSLFSAYMAFMSTQANAEYCRALENEALLEARTKELEKLSHVDGLTGLYNRRYFETAFEVAWQTAVRHQTRLGLVFCDIDFFKKINDDFGHLAGDEYLRTLALELRKVFKRGNDVVARYGGEEFVVLMEGIRENDAGILAETFRKNMEAVSIEFESRRVRATVSLGVAECLPQGDQDREALLSQADIMLYRAKALGRNQVQAQ